MWRSFRSRLKCPSCAAEAIEMPEMPSDIYIGIGSNLGDREWNLRRAISAIAATGLQIIETSSAYESEPVDYLEQPWFLNQVARLGLQQSASIGAVGAMKVLQCLLAIEEAMGRER